MRRERDDGRGRVMDHSLAFMEKFEIRTLADVEAIEAVPIERRLEGHLGGELGRWRTPRHRPSSRPDSTTQMTFEMRTGSPGRTTSTVASANAGFPAPTASCGSDPVDRRSLRPVWVPSTISPTANVAISRSTSVDSK